jgi:hypothetical protein
MSNGLYNSFRAAYNVACGKYTGDVGRTFIIHYEKASQRCGDFSPLRKYARRSLTNRKDYRISLNIMTREHILSSHV